MDTFFCISKSNLMLFSVTILGNLPSTASGVVANISWIKLKNKKAWLATSKLNKYYKSSCYNI